MSERLEKLRQSLHPCSPLDVVEQCRLVAEVLAPGGEYVNNKRGLAKFLNISENKIYKMERVHKDALPETKEWLKGSGYETNMAYTLAVLSQGNQRKFLSLVKEEQAKFLEKINETENKEDIT